MDHLLLILRYSALPFPSKSLRIALVFGMPIQIVMLDCGSAILFKRVSFLGFKLDPASTNKYIE